MRRSIVALVAMFGLSLMSFGCAASNPLIRLEQEMIDQENARPQQDEWRRPWMTDPPEHLAPYRIHGGVGPASSSI